MSSHVAVVGAERVVVKCIPLFARQAEWLLDLLQRLDREQGGLRDGTNIELGWTMLLVRRGNGDLVVHAPDFDRDPFRDTTDDLSLSFEIQVQQNEILQRLGLEGQAASFQDKIVAAKGVLTTRRIYLERASNPTRGDSGWYIGPVDNNKDEPPLEAYYVFQLLKIRPSLLRALALPPGYLVVFEGDTIDAVLDETDVDVWAASAP